jgi:hypothetical protein
MLRARRSRVRFCQEVIEFFFQLTLSFQLHFVSGLQSASDRNEYQSVSREGAVRPAWKPTSQPSVNPLSRKCERVDVSL